MDVANLTVNRLELAGNRRRSQTADGGERRGRQDDEEEVQKKPGVVIASSRAKGTNLAAGTKVALTIAKKSTPQRLPRRPRPLASPLPSVTSCRFWCHDNVASQRSLCPYET